MKSVFSYIISVVLILLCWGVSASASERLFIEAQTLQPGKTTELAICLDNNTDYYGVQADIVLPTGLNFVSTNGKADVRLSDRLSGDYTLVSNIKDNTLRLAAFSTTHTSIAGNQGAILYVTVKASNNFTGGNVLLNNVLLTNKEDKDVAIPDSESSAEIPGTFTVSLDKSSLSMIEGDIETLVAQVTKNGNVEVKSEQWSSSAPSVATVNNGIVTAVSEGKTTITYLLTDNYDKEYSATCDITVGAAYIPALSITLDKTSASLKVGESVSLKATVLPSNATDKTVTWISSDREVATVDANGIVTAVSLGEVYISATCGDVMATCSVSVVPTPAESIEIKYIGDSTEIFVGESLSVYAEVKPSNATDSTVEWSVSDNSIISFENDAVTGLYPGEAYVIATAANGVSASLLVNVKPILIEKIELTENMTLPLMTGDDNALVKLEPKIYPENASIKTLHWSSSNESVGIVSDDNTFLATGVGTTTLTCYAEDGSNVTASCEVTVIIPLTSVKLNEHKISLMEGHTFELRVEIEPIDATDYYLDWTSSDESVAQVDNGIVTAIAEGECKIKVIGYSGIDTAYSDECNVKVTKDFESKLATLVAVDDVTIRVENSLIKIENLPLGKTASVYTLSGICLIQKMSHGENLEFEVASGQAYIVKCGKLAIKVIVQ